MSVDEINIEDVRRILREYLELGERIIHPYARISELGVEPADVSVIVFTLRKLRGRGNLPFNRYCTGEVLTEEGEVLASKLGLLCNRPKEDSSKPYTVHEFTSRLTLDHLVTMVNYDPQPHNL